MKIKNVQESIKPPFKTSILMYTLCIYTHLYFGPQDVLLYATESIRALILPVDCNISLYKLHHTVSGFISYSRLLPFTLKSVKSLLGRNRIGLISVPWPLKAGRSDRMNWIKDPEIERGSQRAAVLLQMI